MKRAEGDIHAVAPGLVNACTPLPGVATGGQPREPHLAALAQAGYQTIVDMRLPEEPHGFDEPAAAAEAGLDYVSLPVGHAGVSDAVIDELRALLADPARQPVLVHCGSGNRVGAALIPHFILDRGMAPQEAVDLAVRVGLRSPDLAQQALGYAERHGAKIREG